MKRKQQNKEIKETKENIPKKSNVPEELDDILQAFKDFDKNDDGKITNHEFKYILTHVGENKFSEKEVDEFFKDCNINEDEELDYEEFILLWKKQMDENPL